MSNFTYTVGLNHAGSYQVAGSPFITGSSVVNQEKIIEFPRVTKNIILENTGAQDIYFYFDSSPTVKLVLPAGKKIDIDIKCKELYVSASASTDFQLFAELTNIPAARMFSLAGLEGI